jgi:tetratricopeptide (TPR) repeat protein
MSHHRRTCWPALLSLASAATQADLASDLADLSARADYGFYTEEPALIEAARRDLERLADVAPVSYYRALAAMRSGQAAAKLAHPAGRLFGECIESAQQSAEQEPKWAEPWVLVAACSTLAALAEPRKALLHDHRFESAVARARSLDPDNPRLALVEAWHSAPAHEPLDDATADVSMTALERTLELFEAEAPGPRTPDWGEAEALALLGALYLERGETRSARDVVERALLAAPGYVKAAELMTRIGSHVGAAKP